MSDKQKSFCQTCRLKNNYKRKDKGAHTATVKECESCGEVKPILDDRHWALGDKYFIK